MSLDVSLIVDDCECCGRKSNSVFDYNITHNLNEMAKASGLYVFLWRPEEMNITLAKDLIGPLEIGLEELKSKPSLYKKYNPPNKWGDYQGLVNFVFEYLEACKQFPKASIYVSR